MATAQDHYEQVLASVYTWMYGGLEANITRNAAFFQHHQIRSQKLGLAIDLGAGSGFQSIPLSQAGFSVLAIDTNHQLLQELEANAVGLNITTVQDDLINFDQYIDSTAELIVCMTDTVLHLETTEKAIALFQKAYATLTKQGQLILTFRDLSHERVELDRFIPVRSDEQMILTCFLEYEPQRVNVHDLLYKKEGDQWQLCKSFYPKLRLSPSWVTTQLSEAGFEQVNCTHHQGMTTIIAHK